MVSDLKAAKAKIVELEKALEIITNEAKWDREVKLAHKRITENTNKLLLEACEILEEAIDLFEAIKEGEYEVDSFTSQPSKLFLLKEEIIKLRDNNANV